MSTPRGSWARWSLLFLLSFAQVAIADDDSFDASAYEKKPFEIGGWLQLKQEDFDLNRAGAFYKLGYYNQAQRESLDRTTGTMELIGKLRQGIGTFDFHTHSDLVQDQLAHDHDNVLYEGAYSIRPSPGVTVEAGKRTLRWGKGYAWNPIGFVERPKDPNDPDLSREGLGMADADLIFNRDGPLQTIAFTPVLLPVGKDVNSDFGAANHLNPAAKLYLLYRDTDIDFAWQGQGSRPGRFGMDFARNLTTNFEIHGEWARIQQFPQTGYRQRRPRHDRASETRPVICSDCAISPRGHDLHCRILSQRHRLLREEARQYYQLVDTAFAQLQQTGKSMLLPKALALSQGSYGRPNPGRGLLLLPRTAEGCAGHRLFPARDHRDDELAGPQLSSSPPSFCTRASRISTFACGFSCCTAPA